MNSQKPRQGNSLPILNDAIRKPSRAYWIHAVRLALFLTILLLIRLEHQRQLEYQQAQNEAPQLDLSAVQEVIPDAMAVSAWSREGLAQVLDESDKEVATLLHTNRESRNIVGYIGPTSLLVYLTPAGKVRDVRILRSADTEEHVDAIARHDAFLDSWDGLTWQEVAKKDDIDAVSGSTLTSFAIQQAIRERFGGKIPSLKFPDPIELQEIQQVWPTATEFKASEENPDWIQAIDSKQEIIGYFIRSSPLADDVNGYQGPTDFLAFFEPSGGYLRMQIRSSYDNMTPEPFVDYVRDEEYFLVDQFAGMSREEICKLDEFDVEGVSGATMTSTGIFRALQRISMETQKEIVPDQQRTQWKLALRDWGVLGIIVIALLITFTKLKQVSSIKTLFQCTLIIYLGFLNGDILSQTLLVGWVQNGVPWHSAIGLVVLTGTALIVPILSKKNIYCHSICPFGAAQFLANKTSKRKFKVPKSLHRWLRKMPAILISVIVLSCCLNWQLNLAALEPFDAFHIRIAGWATLSIAAIGLIASFFIPLAYCKYGCPTGAVLEYARRTGRSGQWGKRDWLALCLVAMTGIFWASGY